MRMLNGNLLVRTGGGYQDLLDALGKLPAPADFSPPAGTAPGATGGISPTPSPRTPTMTAAAPSKLRSDEAPALPMKSSSVGSLGARHSSNGGFSKLGVSHPSTSPRLDLAALHTAMFSSSSGLLPSSRGPNKDPDSLGSVAADGSSSHRRRQPSLPAAADDGSAAAFAAMEAAVQAAVAAAVEAAANAGLDDGTGTSGGGAGPGRVTAHSRAVLLGRAMAAKTAAGTLIEAGMCPPVPVHEEVATPSASESASGAVFHLTGVPYGAA